MYYDVYLDIYSDVYGFTLPSIGHITVTEDTQADITVETGDS